MAKYHGGLVQILPLCILLLALPTIATAQATSLKFDVDATRGWQTMTLRVTKGQQLSFSIVGTWNVGAIPPAPLSYVSADGYSPAEDSTIYQGCKLDAILPYGVLLVRIGADDPSFILKNDISAV